jgi:hypothetical protein
LSCFLCAASLEVVWAAYSERSLATCIKPSMGIQPFPSASKRFRGAGRGNGQCCSIDLIHFGWLVHWVTVHLGGGRVEPLHPGRDLFLERPQEVDLESSREMLS